MDAGQEGNLTIDGSMAQRIAGRSIIVIGDFMSHSFEWDPEKGKEKHPKA